MLVHRNPQGDRRMRAMLPHDGSDANPLHELLTAASERRGQSRDDVYCVGVLAPVIVEDVIDVFHRAAARSYQELVSRLTERATRIAGLTATPERTDGLDILHSFGVFDSADLSDVRGRNGRDTTSTNSPAC
jgi:hypothetical protein